MDQTDHNNALDEARQTIAQLGPIRELAEELYSFPLTLLRQVCQEYDRRGEPVPDHLLSLPPYIGETALRALIEGGLLERFEDQRYAIHAYRPTEAGKAMVRRLDVSADTPSPKRRRRRS